jgi:uncharacterized protein (TIGR03089 family)
VMHAFAAGLRRDPGRPLVTFYDDATGERVELSWATMANWVNKAAVLMHDEMGVEHGDVVAIDLPTHWQGAVVVLACWTLGAVVGDDPACADHEVRLAGGGVDAASGSRSRPLVLALRPMGAPGHVEEDTVDFDREVLGQSDAGPGLPLPAPSDLAIVSKGVSMTHADVADAARRYCGASDTAGARVLSTLPPSNHEGMLHVLSAAIISDGSVVLCRNPDAGSLESRAVQEAVTARLIGERGTRTAAYSPTQLRPDE